MILSASALEVQEGDEGAWKGTRSIQRSRMILGCCLREGPDTVPLSTEAPKVILRMVFGPNSIMALWVCLSFLTWQTHSAMAL